MSSNHDRPSPGHEADDETVEGSTWNDMECLQPHELDEIREGRELEGDLLGHVESCDFCRVLINSTLPDDEQTREFARIAASRAGDFDGAFLDRFVTTSSPQPTSSPGHRRSLGVPLMAVAMLLVCTVVGGSGFALGQSSKEVELLTQRNLFAQVRSDYEERIADLLNTPNESPETLSDIPIRDDAAGRLEMMLGHQVTHLSRQYASTEACCEQDTAANACSETLGVAGLTRPIATAAPTVRVKPLMSDADCSCIFISGGCNEPAQKALESLIDQGWKVDDRRDINNGEMIALSNHCRVQPTIRESASEDR